MKNFESFASMVFWRGVHHLEFSGNGGVIPRRFTQEMQEYYQNFSEFWKPRAEASAGVRWVASGHIRQMEMHLEIPVWHIPHFGFDVRTPEGFAWRITGTLPMEKYTLRIELPENTTGVMIAFPYQCTVRIVNFLVDDDADLQPVPYNPAEQIAFLGDSISQGYYARYPLDSYVGLITEALGRDSINLSVGGMRMHPEPTQMAMAYPWRTAILAYGVNDAACHYPLEKFRAGLRGCLDALTSRKDARIYVLTPIWWPGEPADAVLLAGNRRIFEELCPEYPQVTMIDGLTLVPRDWKYFEDRVHPNTDGMRIYAENLLPHLRGKEGSRKPIEQ